MRHVHIFFFIKNVCEDWQKCIVQEFTLFYRKNIFSCKLTKEDINTVKGKESKRKDIKDS